LQECNQRARENDEPTRGEILRQRSRLYQELDKRRKEGREKFNQLYSTYQPRVPTGKEERLLKKLEEELKLPTLNEVYESVAAMVDSLSEEGYEESLYTHSEYYQDEEPSIPTESQYENYGGDDAVYPEDEGDGYQEEEHGYDDQEFEGNDDENPAHQEETRPSTAAYPQQQHRRVESPLPLEKPPTDDQILQHLIDDPEAITEVQNLHVNRPLNAQGQPIDRGVKGRIGDHTTPIYDRQDHNAGESTPKNQHHGSPKSQQRMKWPTNVAAGGESGEKPSFQEAASSGNACAPAATTATPRSKSPRPPTIACSGLESKNNDDYTDTPSPHPEQQRRPTSFFTKGCKLKDRQMLVKLSWASSNDEQDGIIISAFDVATGDDFRCSIERSDILACSIPEEEKGLGVSSDAVDLRSMGQRLVNHLDLRVREDGETILELLPLPATPQEGKDNE